MVDRDFDDDDMKEDKGIVRKEFECPECNAHNPYPDGFTVGNEVLCFYCGSNFRVAAVEPKVKLKEI